MANTDLQNLNNAAKSIPFDNLIGSPLVACVAAQKQAAEATLEYFKCAGFNMLTNTSSNAQSSSTKTPVTEEYKAATITFCYERMEGDKPKMYKMTVPLITIMPIPYIMIDKVNIKFRAEMSFDQNDRLMARYSTMGYGAEQAQASKFNVQNQLDVEVQASGHELPGGLSKLLEMLGNSMKIEQA